MPECPNKCTFNTNDKICKPDILDENFVCEPTLILSCPLNQYVADITKYKYCVTNPSDMCLTGSGQIRYPLRLQNKYGNIMCKYSTYGTCENKSIFRTCCS